MSAKKIQSNGLNDEIVKEISAAVESLKYGTVTIKVHDAKIIQLEITEKRRFDNQWRGEGGE